ncbi:MAG: hypothetical protein GY732_01515 [Gammaproteobacteria bacterium]|nr:hypothetical protein [Gammaproteobacteria bacterium]
MKFTLKLLLFLCIVFVGIYATTPSWLPYVLEKQLPPGWQLEYMESGYPDLSGIDVSSLRLKAGLPVADIAIAATDLRFGYRDKKVEIDSISLEIFLQATENRSVDSPIPDKLVVNFESFQFDQLANGSYRIDSDATFEDFPRATGHIEAYSNPGLLKADIRFPASLNLPSWLAVQIEQKDQAENTVTQVHAVLDTESANQDWLGSLLMRYTHGLLTKVKGKLEIQSSFTGLNLQDVEHLSLNTEKLEILSSSGALDIKAELAANREGKNIVIKLPTAAEIQFQDKAGVIDLLLISTFPEFQRAPRSDAVAFLKLGTSSRFSIQPDTSPSIDYSGAISLDLGASGETIRLHSDNLHAVMAEFPELESLTTVGLIAVDWQEDMGLAYVSEDLELKAEEMFVTGEISAHNGKYTSKGAGTLTDIRITQPVISAQNIEMEWQGLDLLNMTGKLSTRTQGFSTDIDAETWTGFDFDVNYRLLEGTGINGLGKLKVDDGPHLPLKYAGNTDTNKWDITLPRSRIDMKQLTRLLAVAHIELPGSVKLTDGYIHLQGEVAINDKVTARMDITGHDIDASMLKSHARDAGFSFKTAYDDTISANGPVSIETITLAGGIDVTDIKADLQLVDSDTYRMKNLSARLFGGQLKLNQLQYSNNRLEDTRAELSNISLGQLLEFADFDGLKGTGSLDLSLPVNTDQTGINISNGLFRSTVPGYLAYTKEGVAESNIGLQALENFQYQDLSGEINYQSDGSYQIKVHLEGNNPDLYEGHPVVFNLNINGSFPELFEALFITGDFEEAILKEIRKQQNYSETP